VFSDTKAEVIDRADRVLLTVKREGGLYYFSEMPDAECRKISGPDDAARIVKKDTLEDWHIRMGYLNVRSLREAIRTGSIQGVNVENINEDL